MSLAGIKLAVRLGKTPAFAKGLGAKLYSKVHDITLLRTLTVILMWSFAFIFLSYTYIYTPTVPSSVIVMVIDACVYCVFFHFSLSFFFIVTCIIFTYYSLPSLFSWPAVLTPNLSCMFYFLDTGISYVVALTIYHSCICGLHH